MAIKGKAKAEFGTGDIRITPILSGEIGALCLKTEEPPTPIGTDISNKGWLPEQSEVVLTFTKTESIDVLIRKLHAVKDFMQGFIPPDGQLVENSLDLDSFMEK